MLGINRNIEIDQLLAVLLPLLRHHTVHDVILTSAHGAHHLQLDATHGAAGAAEIRKEARQHAEIEVCAQKHLARATLVMRIPAIVMLRREIATR